MLLSISFTVRMILTVLFALITTGLITWYWWKRGIPIWVLFAPMVGLELLAIVDTILDISQIWTIPVFAYGVIFWGLQGMSKGWTYRAKFLSDLTRSGKTDKM